MRMWLVLLLAACDDAKVVLDDSGAGNDADDTGDIDDSGDSGEDTSVVVGDLEVSPPSIDLATLFVGQTTSAEITLTNVGEADLSVTLSVAGGWSTSYTLDAYSASLAPGETVVRTLTLTPTSWGDHAAGVLVDDASTDTHVEIPVAASVQEDLDQDGHGSEQSGGDDCDDAVATTHAGAAETWYDGVDSDCAGDDDYDQDADGARVDVDCDDTDASLYPGAADAWYDGVDSDCAHDDDYDQDADGWVPSEYAGMPTSGVDGSGSLPSGDCVDTDAAIHPAAAETWYDGTDQDCDGADDDQDGDGFLLADDCDDTDAAVYPGAAETWYDGVDGDCAGDDDYDQDADGVDYPADCNDTDPSTTGPTTESLNGIDDDCDGTVDDFGVSDVATGVLYGYSSGMALGDHGQMAISDDVTGDGLADLLVGTTEPSDGYVWIVKGATAAAASGSVANYDTAVLSGDSSYYPIGYLNGPFADTDGDGVDDLVVGGAYSSGYSGYSYARTYLLEGGSSLSGSISTSSYDARFEGDSTSDYVSMGVTADVDGDGLADVIVGAAYDNSSRDYDSGSVAVFLAGFSGSYELDEADERVYGDDGSDYLGYSLVAADVDSDGVLDVLAGAPGEDSRASNGGAVYLLAGSTAFGWDTYASDAAFAQIEGTAASLALGQDTLPHPGDVDGDGALDVGLAVEASGDAWLFLDAGSLSGSVALTSADHTWSGTANDLGSMMILDSDLDGDGAADVVLGADGDDSNGSNSGTVFIYTGASGWGASMATTDASVTVSGPSADAYFGSGGAGGADLDGDGRDDVAVGAVSCDDAASGAGAVFVIPGW